MKTPNFELVELICPANSGNRVFFQDVQQLRAQSGQNVEVVAIDAFSNQAVSLSPTGNTMIAIADFKKAFLVLNEGGRELKNKIPLALLNRVDADFSVAANFVPGQVLPFEFESLRNVDWTKSYVMFASAPVATSFSVLFGVHYRLIR
jgi:hypothetical protein